MQARLFTATIAGKGVNWGMGSREGWQQAVCSGQLTNL